MEENPYAGILEVVRTDADTRSASPWVIGTVAATAPPIWKTEKATP